jgi:uncharacterized protein
MKWYRLAADEGNSVAQCVLGLLYAAGRGAPQDNVIADMWLNVAGGAVYDYDYEKSENLYQDKKFIEQRMTAAQIAEAQKLAREWKPTTQPPR